MPILGSSSSGGSRPTTPTIGTATAGNGSASVPFTASSYVGKGTITYTATSSPGGFTGTSSSPITVSGLTNGTSYTFTVVGTTNYGISSEASGASNSVSPSEPKASYFSNGSSDNQRVINKLDLNTDTVSSSLLMPVVRQNSGYGVSNSATAGYFGSGYFNGGLAQSRSSVDKIVYSSETLSTVIASGATQCIQSAAMSNSGTAGYHAGGESGQTFSAINTIGKITFSNDTYTIVSGKTLPQARLGTAGMSNRGTAGYVVSGNTSSLVVKFTFSNETAANLSIGYDVFFPGGFNSNNAAAFSNSGTAGYGACGSDRLQSIKKILFSNDTISNLSATINTGRNAPNGSAAKGSAGYVAGGGGSSGPISTIAKLAFSNETTSVLSDTISHSLTIGMFSVANEGTL
jgi:hypothetical protein